MTASPDLAVDLRGVFKTYRGGVVALKGVDLAVPRGQIFGLLGPNGAGKSTLVKIMLSIIRPSRCEGTLLGRPVGDRATLRRVGYLPEGHRFPKHLTGRRLLEFFAALSGVGRAARKRRAEHLLDVVGLTSAADRRVNTYSKGMAQRIGVAQALMNHPDLVLLDEPTDGVDPLARRNIRDVLYRLRDAGKAVIVNSHLLSELEILADRVALLVNGQIVMQGTMQELAGDGQAYEIEIEADADVSFLSDAWTPTPNGRRGTTSLGGEVVSIDQTHGSLRLGTDEAGVAQVVLDELRRHDVLVKKFVPLRPTLEDLFIRAVTPGAPR